MGRVFASAGVTTSDSRHPGETRIGLRGGSSGGHQERQMSPMEFDILNAVVDSIQDRGGGFHKRIDFLRTGKSKGLQRRKQSTANKALDLPRDHRPAQEPVAKLQV